MKKKIIILTIAFFMFSLGKIEVLAATVSFPGAQNNQSGDNNAKEPTRWFDYDVGNRRFRYRYIETIIPDGNIQINAYNLNGESVIPNKIDEFIQGTNFKSGTWIGINITETQSVSWSISNIEVEEVKKKYTCKYISDTQECSYYDPKTIYTTENNCTRNLKGIYYKATEQYDPSIEAYIGKCKYTVCQNPYYPTKETESKTVNYHDEMECDKGEPNQLSPDPTTKTNEYIDAITSEAATKTRNKAASMVNYPVGMVEYIVNNKYSENIKDITNLTANVILTGENEINKGTSGAIFKYYLHQPSKVCMNLKNAEVTYEEQCVPNSEKGIIEIKNGTTYDKYLGKNIEYWHYFIPLNNKSNAKFYLNIVENKNKILDPNQCENLMKTYDNYTNYIIPIEGTYSGDYNTLKTSSNDWKLTKNKGCYFTATVNFPIIQKFYNEEKNNNNQIIFKGFNFYYRAIDINNPFPNGIATDSYWYEWAQSQKANQNPTPNLSKSFATKTYEAKNISASAVRKYNEEHPYTSWDEMNINGSSSLINSNKISNTLIERIGNNRDYYKLGCGPANEDWEGCR